MPPSRKWPDWLGLAVLVIIWGSAFVGIKFALTGIGPYWLAAARLILAAGAMVVFARFASVRLPRGRREWTMVSVMGVAGTAMPFMLINWSSQFVASGIAGLMMAANPFLVVALSIFVLPEERATRTRMAGLVVGFAGVAMVIAGRQDSAFSFGAGLLAYLALLAASAGYAINAVFGRKAASIPPLTRAYGSLLTAAAAGIMALLFEPLPGLPPPDGLVAILYLAFLPTWAGALLMFFILDRTSAGFLAQSNYLVPAAAIAFGALIFSEQLHALQYLGFAVILVGIALAEGALTRRWAGKVLPDA